MANAADTGTFQEPKDAGMTGINRTRAIALLRSVRERQPHVHCLTNDAARTLTANVLLSLGCEPSLSYDPYEVRAFVDSADAFLANLGTLSRDMKAAIDIGITSAKDGKKPWVLDPVFCNRSPKRAEYALACLSRQPAAMRLNPIEAKTLGSGALQTAVAGGAVVAMSGQTDHVYGKGRQMAFRSGHLLMGQVTGMGCALGAVMAAFLTASDKRFDAIAAATIVFASAGAVAGARAAGPGSFVPEFLDALHNLEAADLAERSAT